MTRKILKNKPLIEAIFELRWGLEGSPKEIKIDPLLIGRIYDRIKEEYPFYEKLPAANIPDELASYVIQHRFRKGKDEWPLIQIGPGIITLNETERYTWDDFKRRVSFLIETLLEIYSSSDNLVIRSLLLRYIDAIEFDYEKNNVLSYLNNNMRMNVDVCPELFEYSGIDELPLSLDLKFTFPTADPKGTVHLRFARGKVIEKDALLWETLVQSVDGDTPGDKDDILEWVDEAHNLTDDWFFKIIEGDLLRRFE